MGPANETPEGQPLPMAIEPWPGGRWFRDLGNNNGHLWGHVQAIKRPTLLEITGPLSCRSPVVSNVQYRLTEVDGGTLIAFRHTAFGFVPDNVRDGLSKGGCRFSKERANVRRPCAARAELTEESLRCR